MHTHKFYCRMQCIKLSNYKQHVPVICIIICIVQVDVTTNIYVLTVLWPHTYTCWQYCEQRNMGTHTYTCWQYCEQRTHTYTCWQYCDHVHRCVDSIVNSAIWAHIHIRVDSIVTTYIYVLTVLWTAQYGLTNLNHASTTTKMTKIIKSYAKQTNPWLQHLHMILS